eukprot:TRINITY_DN4691_c0_g2_i1.p1 TRINITY_DN4691_c0_g2~~TRINITY_DN4691_c0_g2_i1.p1  ORF type:complete len:702 (-),score=106.65 TRINITY_DN4691_c0_g2_i1:3-2108(-)
MNSIINLQKQARALTSLSWSTGLVAEIILGFVFWSVFLEFISVLWFFPLELMGFSGWEGILVILFTPVLSASRKISSLLDNHFYKFRLVALLAGLLAFNSSFQQWYVRYYLQYRKISFTVHPNGIRLLLVSVTVGFEWLSFARRWVTADKDTVDRNVWGFLLGFLAQAIVRMAFYTLNPFLLWDTPNILCMVAVVLSVFYLLREERSSLSEANMKKDRSPYDPKFDTHSKSESTQATLSVCFLNGMGLGTLIFLTQTMFSAHGVLPRWLEIDPFPYGIFVLFGFAVGIVQSYSEFNISASSSLKWAALTGIFGSLLVGLAQLNLIPKWVGLVGGALLGAYTASQWVPIVRNFSTIGRPSITMLFAFITYVVLLFWAIEVVAFKFLPWFLGSNFFRERQNSMIFVSAILIAIARFGTVKIKERPYWFIRREQVVGLTAVFLLLAVPAVTYRVARISHFDPDSTIASTQPLNDPTQIKAMVWNIHFGYDHYGRSNFERVADSIRREKINVLGIMESDLTRLFTSNRDFVEYLETELQMYSDFGPSTTENTWGCALITAFPIINVTRAVLPSPEGELACLLDATLNVSGTAVTVLVTHFGNTEDKLDRDLQTEAMVEVSKSKTTPTIFLGYITDKPHSVNYSKLVKSGLVDTTTDRNRYCQYVFYKPGDKGMSLTNFYRWDSRDLSDTEGQIGEFTLQQYNKQN